MKKLSQVLALIVSVLLMTHKAKKLNKDLKPILDDDEKFFFSNNSSINY